MWKLARRAAGRRPPPAKVRLWLEVLEDRWVPSAFTAGDLILLRIGNGTTALDTSATSGALVELTTAGTNPSGGPNVVNLPTFGSNNQGGITFSGAASMAAGLTRSADGHYLTTIGYDAAPGTANVIGTTATAANRNVALIDSSGNVSIVAKLTDAYSNTTAAGVMTTDGAAFYTTGTADGLRYFSYSGTAVSTSTSIVSGTNLLSVDSVGGNIVYDSTSAVNRLSGAPTSAAAGTSLGITIAAGRQFVFLDRQAGVGDPNLGGYVDTLYVANAAPTGSLAKYYWTGTSWASAGSMNISGQLFGIVGQVNGGSADLYLTTNTASTSALLKLTDTASYSSAPSGSPTTLASAGTNYFFRGIAFAPTAPPANSAPALDGANNFAAIDEDDTTNGGTLVSALLSGHANDADGDAVGIAITAVNTASGSWQYKAGGGSWTNVGSVSDSAALLLGPSDGLRFVPNANFNGTVSPGVTFRAWDQTSGTAGGAANTSPNGGTSAFSSTSFSSDITVNAVNDAPSLSGANDLADIDEDVPGASNAGTLVSALISGKVTDPDGPGAGIAITAAPLVVGGTWQYTTDGGSHWSQILAVANGSALLLAADANTRIRFVPDPNYSGTPSTGITFRAWDQSAGSNGDTADTTTNGNASPFSTATATAKVTVQPVNDAPVNAVPGDQTTPQDTPLVFSAADHNAISVADVDADPAGVQVKLTAAGGTVLLGSTSGLATLTGNGTAVVTFTGTTSTVNAALEGLTFTPNSGFSGDASLTIDTSDLGNTGSGGVLTDSDSIKITVTAVVSPNQSPTLTATALSPTFTENGSAAGLFSGASADTVESGQQITQLALTVSNVTDGASEVLTIDGSGVALTDANAVTTTVNGLTATVSLTGTTATVTISKVGGFAPSVAAAVVNGLAYRNASEAPTAGNRVVALTSISDDGGTANGGHDTATLSLASTVTVVAVNDAPTNAVPGPQNATEDTPLVFSSANAISVSDADAGSNSIQVKLTAAHGTATLGNASGVMVTAGGNGTATVTFTGPVSAVNLALDGLTFTPAPDYNGAAGLTIDADDLGHAGTGAGTDSDMIGITLAAVNDAPTFALGGDVEVGEDAGPQSTSGFASNFKPGPVTATDEATQTLAHYTASVTGTTGNLVFTAAPAIDATGKLTFTTAPDSNGTATVKVTATDSAGATSAALAFTITADAVNDPPAFDLAAATVTADENGGAFGQSGFASNFQPGPATATDEAAQTLDHYTLTVTGTTGPLTFANAPAIDAAGTLTFTPAANAYGTATVRVTATDSAGATSAAQTFTITVNAVADAPIATDATTDEDTQTATGLLISRNPADGAEVTHFRVTGITGGTLFLADGTTAVGDGDFVAFGAGGSTQLRFTPVGDRNDNTDSFGFSVQASIGASASGLGGSVVPVAVHVMPVNDRPSVAFAAATVAVTAVSDPVARAAFATFAPGGGPDEASQVPAYTVQPANPALFLVQPAINPGGALTFTLKPGTVGSTTVTVTARDGGGTAHGGQDTSLAQQFTIRADPPTPPAQLLAAGADAGGEPSRVRLLDPATGSVLREFVPFPGYRGGVAVAVGDVDGDHVDEVVVASATGAAQVKVFSAAGVEMKSFAAFPRFRGGLSLAVGDVNHDGRADIVVGTAALTSVVAVFSGADGKVLRAFAAFPGFTGGVRVATGDVNGDGFADIGIVAGPGGGGHVKVIDGKSGALAGSFLSFAGYRGEVSVALGDVNADGRAEVIAAMQDPLRGAHVKVLTSRGGLLRNFFAPTGPTPPVGFGRGAAPRLPRAPHVSTADVTGDHAADILLGSPAGVAGGRFVIANGETGSLVRSRLAFDPLFNLGVYVG